MGEQWFDLPVVSPSPVPGNGGRAERTRAALIATAAAALAEHGYHRTTLRDVLCAAGVTKGALYFHFDSKFALARAVCDEASRSWATLLAAIDERRLDPLQVLLVQADATVLRFAHDVPLRAALRIGTEARESGDMLTRWRTAWERRTTELMCAAQDQGLLRPVVPAERLGRHAVAMMLGHQAFAAHLPPSADDPWARIGEWWEDMLTQLAAPEWLADWRASGWHDRARPGP